ncbi:MAG: hypothetical protein Q4B80_03920 [Aerococcaceae bacterium]|nr:hypothetical protein [Aerococcaceae bacterium]
MKRFVLVCALWLGLGKLAPVVAQETAPVVDKPALWTQLSELAQLEQYEASYVLTNIRNGRPMAKLRIIGDQVTNRQHIIADFYFRDVEPNHYQLEMIAYQDLGLVYVKQFAFLQSMAFFEQEQLPEQMADAMSAYQDYYVATQSKVEIDPQDWAALIHLIPDAVKFDSVNESAIYQLNDLSLAHMEKLAIPEYFFEGMDFLALDYQLDLEVVPQSETDWQVAAKGEVIFDKISNNLKMNAEVEALLNPADLDRAHLPNWLSRAKPFSREMGLDGTALTSKLKKVFMSHNEALDKYHIQLDGVVESMNLNVLGEGAASIKSYDFRLDYEIQPTTQTIPDMLELQRLSQAEFAYIIENYLEQSTIQEEEMDNDSQ